MITLDHEEANIRCAMVLLQCRYETRQIPLPLAVAMAPMHLQEEAWRAAAINHLNDQGGLTRRAAEEKAKREQAFIEENMKIDWEERRERAK